MDRLAVILEHHVLSFVDVRFPARIQLYARPVRLEQLSGKNRYSFRRTIDGGIETACGSVACFGGTLPLRLAIFDPKVLIDGRLVVVDTADIDARRQPIGANQ